MSTQYENGIEFSLLPEESQQHFRLLELPAELLSVLTTDNALPLQLKSQEAPPGSLSGPNVVLCTQDKTYNIRQVSTSNSVFVVQPSPAPNDSLAAPGVEAVAQCTSTLELLPVKEASAIPHIKTVLPTYTSTGYQSIRTSTTKQRLFSSIPLNDAECENAWLELACFELDGSAMVPSASVRLKVWREILNAATAGGVGFNEAIDDEDLQTLVSKDSEWPAELHEAILRSVATPSSTAGKLKLDGDKLALALGLSLLKDQTSNGRHSIPLAGFQTEWADLMPEAWRAKATIDKLEGSIRHENGGKDIAFVDNSKAQTSAADGAAAGDGQSGIGAKRKWHEKFRAAKKSG